MPKKPTATDAQLIMQLYDLRREPEMRKARNWWVTTFWPESADDFLKVGWAMGTQENNWLRQVIGYWSMASSFVLHGAAGETRRCRGFREHREGHHRLQVRTGAAEVHAQASRDDARKEDPRSA